MESKFFESIDSSFKITVKYFKLTDSLASRTASVELDLNNIYSDFLDSVLDLDEIDSKISFIQRYLDRAKKISSQFKEREILRANQKG